MIHNMTRQLAFLGICIHVHYYTVVQCGNKVCSKIMFMYVHVQYYMYMYVLVLRLVHIYWLEMHKKYTFELAAAQEMYQTPFVLRF